MPVRLKKILGALFIVAFLLTWIFAGVTLSRFIPQHWAPALIYYAVVGIGWAFPLMPVLKWMEKKVPPKASQ